MWKHGCRTAVVALITAIGLLAPPEMEAWLARTLMLATVLWSAEIVACFLERCRARPVEEDDLEAQHHKKDD
jgi:hypothetical protein